MTSEFCMNLVTAILLNDATGDSQECRKYRSGNNLSPKSYRIAMIFFPKESIGRHAMSCLYTLPLPTR